MKESIVINEKQVSAPEQATSDKTFTIDAMQIFQGATWFAVAMVVGTLLEYGTQGLLAARLGPQSFGVFSLGLNIFSVASLATALALPGAVAYFIPSHRARGELALVGQLVGSSLWLSVGASVAVGAILFFLGDFIAVNLLGEPSLVSVLRLFALALPSTAIVLVIIGSLRGLKRSWEASLLSSGYERALRLIFIVILLAIGLGVDGAAFAYLPASLAVAILGIHYLRRRVAGRIWMMPSGAAAGKLLSYSWPLWLSQLLAQLKVALQPLLLAHFLDATAVGLYAVAWLVAQTFSLVLTAFNFLYIPVVSEVNSTEGVTRMRRLYRSTTLWGAIAILPTYLLLLVLPESFLGLFGSQYVQGAWVLRILATSIVVGVSVGAVGATLLATGQTRTYLSFNVVGSALHFVFAFLLIGRYGLIGAGVAALLTTVLWNLLMLQSVYRSYGMQPFNRRYLYAALVALGILLLFYPVLRLLLAAAPWAIIGFVPLHTGLSVFILLKFNLLDDDSHAIAVQLLSVVGERLSAIPSQLRRRLQEASRK